ncbi:helix-turn-helix transcriptional regulator [Clostridium tagluense]|uniref:Transcriptional regulator n=1 Tax=Clostridium tagluense TaxID=360422 RepID=A0A401US87_9CLOT|nr:helix-turn-helix transcriptional regulator [Clostridium tagluense]MBW9159513.1 helix-turn-helix transcriptional regulator [Clostridium tagluense]MCB2299468.1 helix-turn-helix transcriptional regulator [Clostridium tagluense]WLC68513.1 helix-turn-helix transcriptional regulator [Clostridium tagluense]GCD12374.1 transcriptional regulator [Clostridium tagluense]
MKNTVFNKVKYKRTSFNFTQEQLANIVGVTRLTIISIEKQKYEPSIGLAIKLANAFNCNVEDLFMLEGEG